MNECFAKSVHFICHLRLRSGSNLLGLELKSSTLLRHGTSTFTSMWNEPWQGVVQAQ